MPSISIKSRRHRWLVKDSALPASCFDAECQQAIIQVKFRVASLLQCVRTSARQHGRTRYRVAAAMYEPSKTAARGKLTRFDSKSNGNLIQLRLSVPSGAANNNATSPKQGRHHQLAVYEGRLLQTRRRLPAALRRCVLPRWRAARVTADGFFVHSGVVAAAVDGSDIEIVDLAQAAATAAANTNDPAAFQLVTADGKRRRFLAADAADREAWMSALRSGILASLRRSRPDASPRISANNRPASSPVASSRAAEILLKAAVSLPGNEACADCAAPAPDWAIVSHGMLVCILCSGAHRRLGTHASRVRSLALDAWTPSQAMPLCVVGNRLGNAVWEARLPSGRRPPQDASIAVREEFVRAKYERGEFLASLNEDVGA